MADHNDPNAVNANFSDVAWSAADLFDLFGFPSAVGGDGERVFTALTFAAIPDTGVFDTDVLYRMRVTAHPRVVWAEEREQSLDEYLKYVDEIRARYFGELRSAEIRVKVGADGRAVVDFHNFRGMTFSTTIDTNAVAGVSSPNGDAIQLFVGGRDDAFFNDLTGFFRSINYAPQFYHVPSTRPDLRELPIPKTLIELEGNPLFNFDPARPKLGYEEKADLPPGPYTWSGDRFAKDADGNFRFAYTGEDARAGKNSNVIAVEFPLSLVTDSPDRDRIVNVWGESWVRKGSGKVPEIPDHFTLTGRPYTIEDWFHEDAELRQYKLVDTDGQPFADAGLSQRENDRQVGANNFQLAPHFVKRVAHLGWGFGPSISALGLATSFDHDNSPVSVDKSYDLAVDAFPRARRVLFQQLNMPDDSWNPRGLDIPLRRPSEIFIPNVCAIDMDTTGTWPYGRRLTDQVATRFLSLFLDMSATLNGAPYHIETLASQALWDGAPIVPKTPPNPLRNDKEFLPEFPYFAPPW